MAGGEQDSGDELDPARQPPPETPAPPDEAPPASPEVQDAGPDGEAGSGGGGASGWEWWRTADVRDELRDTWDDVRGEFRDVWDEHGSWEGVQAAYEIGGQIGEAVASRLPDRYAAAEQRGLDLRWLRLGVNVPALVCSLLVTWGGRSAEDRMADSMFSEGLLAPVGWVLLPVLVLAVLLALPFGAALGAVVGDLVSMAARTVIVLLRRAWGTPYVGYMLRLIVAVAAWSFVIAAARLMGRSVINWLTGV